MQFDANKSNQQRDAVPHQKGPEDADHLDEAGLEDGQSNAVKAIEEEEGPANVLELGNDEMIQQ